MSFEHRFFYTSYIILQITHPSEVHFESENPPPNNYDFNFSQRTITIKRTVNYSDGAAIKTITV